MAMWRNTEQAYGIIAIALHWLVAVVVLGLFGLGLWMVNLTYYDTWYRTAPSIHKSVGVLLFLVMALRLLWRLVNPRPAPEPGLRRIERLASRVVHGVLYLLLFAVMGSGYLISTADGRAIDVLGVFTVPATLTGLPNQADLAGNIHLALAITVIVLAAIHALAALKHHVFDRDRTLLRMLGRSRPQATDHLKH